MTTAIGANICWACLCRTRVRNATEFLAENEIRVESLSGAAHFVASLAWRARDRFCRPFGGAHAAARANRLLMRDRRFLPGDVSGLAVAPDP